MVPQSQGPFTVPRSPQGHPVLIQAGQIGPWPALRRPLGRAGLRDLPERGGRQEGVRRASRTQVAKCGRNPAHVKVAPAIYVITGETRPSPEAKLEVIDKLAKPVDALALLSEVLNFDFASKAMDEPSAIRS